MMVPLEFKIAISCKLIIEIVKAKMNLTVGSYHVTSSQHRSIILPVWLDGWVFVYELSGYEFESRCNHLKWICLLKLWGFDSAHGLYPLRHAMKNIRTMFGIETVDFVG